MTTTPAASNVEEVTFSSTVPEAEDWGEPIVEPHSDPDRERLFRRRTGFVPPVVPYIAPHPWVHRAFLFLMSPSLQALDEQRASKISFIVARDNTCRFCYGSFHSFLRVTGYSEEEVDRLESERYLKKEGAEQEVLRFALDISRGRLQRTSSVVALREMGYGPTGIREIAGMAVMTALINRVATMLAVPLSDALETFTDQWYFDALQPVVQTLLGGWQRLGGTSESPLEADAVEGPFAPWMTRLRGTHVGRVLYDMTTQWRREESALSLRTKLLILAVVARGLGCKGLEEQARALLGEHDDVSARDFEAAVNHLRGDALRERATGLLPLARASIRYEAGRIQQTVREYTRDLSRAETIDAMATLGLSNALARLRALAPLDD